MIRKLTEPFHKAICSRRTPIAGMAIALAMAGNLDTNAAEPVLTKIAVFDFVLLDRSAGGGVIEPDAVDAENLVLSTEQARRQLSESGRYSLVDTSSVSEEFVAAGGVQDCNGCEGKLARELGADLAMAGIISRITRTEYTIQLLVRDAQSGEVISNDFTGLRMGANYSWPRGVKSLIKRRVLAEENPK